MQIKERHHLTGATILRVSSLLYCGSMVENSLSEAASTPKSAVRAISITITTIVMATGRLTPRRRNQVTKGLSTMAKERQQELNYDVGGRMDTRKDNHQTGEF